MGNKGSNTTTQTSSTSPSPQAMDAYTQLLNRAQGVASTPYTPYSGELVAGVNGQQNAGIGGINQYAGFAQPYIQQAAGYANNAAQPLTAAQIQQYQDPFTQQVVNATQAQFNQQNQIQQSQLKGNEIAQGALGGDRNIIAASTLANQQQQAQAPVIAGLYSHGYGQALQTAEQQQQNQANAAYSLGNLGVAGQNAGLTGATAQIGAGSLQQGTQQALDAAQLQQFQTGQAFPYQQTQWLAGLDTGVGSQLGGTTTGRTTAPPPNPVSQYGGLALAGLGLFAKRGGRVQGFAPGGDVGSGPYAGVGWIPSIGITPGHGAPSLPSGGGQQQQPSPNTQALTQGFKGGKGLGADISNWWNGYNTDGSMSGDQWLAAGQGEGAYAPIDTPVASPLTGGLGGLYHRGGGIRGFADGGSPDGRGDLLVPSFADRWATLADTPHAPLSADDVAAGSPFTLPDAAHGVPRPTVNYSGGDIDATDINLDADRLGLGSPYSNTNPAIDADAGAPRVGSPDAAPFDQLGHRTAGADVGAGGPLAYGAGYAPPAGDDSPTGAAAAPQAGFGFGLLSPAAKQGLLAAGFGMMASRSPFLGNAIGEGGLAGLNAYSGQKATEFAQEQKKLTTAQANRRLDTEAQRLSQAAEQSRKALDLRTQQVAETAKYHEGMLDRSALKPSGTVTADGHPIMYDARKPGVALDGVTGEQIKADAKVTAGKAPPNVVGNIVDAITTGKQPPVLTGLYGASPQVRSGLQEKGFDLANAQIEWKRAEKQISTLNGPQMTRFVGLAQSVNQTIDEARDLSRKMQLSGVPLANKAELAAYIQAFGNTEGGQLATRYVTAINTLKEEFANLAQGGYAPTESAWHLANQQINENFGVKQLDSSLSEVQRLINYRVHAIPNLSTLGAGAPNRYFGNPAGGNPAQQQGQGAGQADPLADARAAIARGVSRDAVLKRLQEHGIDATGL